MVAGGTVKFTISVINQGNVEATAVQVSDYIPTGLTLNDGNWTNTGGVATLNTVIASLPAGQTVTRDITFTVSSSFTGSLTNTAEISSSTGGTDIDSSPDGNQTNDGTSKNDVINEDGKNGGDEDDSDPETITVTNVCIKPTLTANSPICNGTTYSISFYSSISTVTASVGTVNGSVVSGIPVGTNVVLTATQSESCISSLTVVSPVTCTPTDGCVLPKLSVGQPICNQTNYTVSFTVSGGTITTSAGTVIGNTITGIPIGTNIVITATNATGANCKAQVNVTSPTNCDKPCENPAVTISGPICGADGKYSVNFVVTAGTTITASSGIVGDGVITGIVSGTDLTLTAKTTGCSDKVVVVPAPNCFQPIFDLAIRKNMIGTGPFKAGDAVPFEIVVFNQGTAAAFNVEVTDYIPTGMSLVAGNGWAISGSNAVQTVAGPIAPNSSVVIPITLKIDTGFTGTNLTNVVEITKADDDNNPTNTPPTDIDSTPGNKAPGEDDIDQTPIPFSPSTPPPTPVFDLALTKKKIGSGPFTAGSLVSFEIAILNQGNVPAFNVEVTDKIPAGMSLVSGNGWTASGSNAVQTFAGPVPVGGSVVSIITLKISDSFTGTKLENVAEITKADDDTNPANTPPTDKDSTPGNGNPTEDDQDKDIIELTPKPAAGTFDLAIVKKHVGKSPYTVGDTVTFSLTVLNQGSVPAFNVEITDYIPAGLTLVDATWTASGTKATQTISGPIAAGSSAAATIKLRINNDFTGKSLTNEVEISKADDDSNPANTPPVDVDGVIDNNQSNNGTTKDDVTNEDNKANASNDLDNADIDRIDVLQKPVLNPIFDLAIRKNMIGTGPFKAGDAVPFEIVVFNQGTAAAFNVEVTDYIPTGMSLVAGNGWAISGSNAVQTVAGPIAPNSSVVIPITLKIDTGFTGTNLTNVVEITKADDDNNPTNTPPTDIDSTPGNKAPGEDDIDQTPIPFSPSTPPPTPVFDLALTKKKIGSGPFTAGSLVSFEIAILNQGNVPAFNVEVTDKIPAGMSLVSGNGWTASGSNAVQTFAGPVPVGGSVVSIITLKISDSFTGTKLENVAEITKADDDTNPANTPPTDKDSTPGNGNPTEDDQDKDIIELTPKPAAGTFDLAIVKKHVGKSPYTVGDTVTFSLTVLNQGSVPAFNVEITDYIPAGLTLVDATWTASGTKATQTISGPIAAGSSAAATIKLRINNDFTGKSLTNEVEISKADDDSNPANTPPVDVDGVIDNNQSNNGTTKDDVTNENNKANASNDLDNADIDRIDVLPIGINCKPADPALGTNAVVCVGEPLPKLTVMVANGLTADWFTAQTGGTKVAGDTITFQPLGVASANLTFYVESKSKTGDCITTGRTPIKITVSPSPVLNVQLPTCAGNRSTYSVKLTSNGTITTGGIGTVTNNNDGTFTITNVPIGQPVVITATLATSCKAQTTVQPPNCDCPPQQCIPFTIQKVRK